MAAHGHAKSDLRNLQLHRVVVQKLGETPALRAPCLALAERWLASPQQSSSRSWLHQWVEMLRDWPIEEIARIVLDPDGGQTLRQCSPLGPALTPRERWAVLAEVNDQPATTGAETGA